MKTSRFPRMKENLISPRRSYKPAHTVGDAIPYHHASVTEQIFPMKILKTFLKQIISPLVIGRTRKINSPISLGCTRYTLICKTKAFPRLVIAKGALRNVNIFAIHCAAVYTYTIKELIFDKLSKRHF